MACIELASLDEEAHAAAAAAARAGKLAHRLREGLAAAEGASRDTEGALDEARSAALTWNLDTHPSPSSPQA